MNYAQREADWWVRHSEKLKKEVKRLREENEKLYSRCMHLENLLEDYQGAYE